LTAGISNLSLLQQMHRPSRIADEQVSCAHLFIALALPPVLLMLLMLRLIAAAGCCCCCCCWQGLP
jgi:hypothetical protein